MPSQTDLVDCPACGRPTTPAALAESVWLPAEVRHRFGAYVCPNCGQRALREWLARRIAECGDEGCSPFDNDGRLIPYGVLPTAWQLDFDTHFTGRGVTMAMVDSGFYPHADLTGLPEDDSDRGGRLRLRAWADVHERDVKFRYFHPLHAPKWPGWSRRAAEQWHGTMTAGAAAGDGGSSRGWYRGLAPDADLVFVQTWDDNGRITNASIARALRWLLKHRERLRLRVVNISVSGDPVGKLRGNYVDAAVRHLVEAGVVVVAAAGNAGKRGLVPPATSVYALTVGGVDMHNTPNPLAWRMWNGNWGRSSAGTPKPDLLAPSNWLAAPILPGSPLEAEAMELFARRAAGDPEVEARIAEQKLLTPSFQHVDGTSFAAPLVSAVIACMLEAKPNLTPDDVRRILTETALPLPGVAEERQGAGVMRPAEALALV